MTTDLLDKVPIDLGKCPNCKRKISKTFGWLKSHGNFACVCGHISPINRNGFTRELRKVDRSIEDIKKTLKSINKRK